VSVLAARRWLDEGTVWFAVSGIGAELAGAAAQVLMGYEHAGPQWQRGYPAGAPHLEQAWQNFARYIEAVLRQAARLDPVPWRDALREVCQRTSGQPVDWWLTGSAALAVRGVPVEPGDLDLVCDAQGATVLGDLFRDTLIEPVVPAGEEWVSDWWGRAFCGARIEWIGGARPFVDEPLPVDFGPVAASRLETVTFGGWPVRVPPLDLQRAVSQRRGLADRVAMIDTLVP
jgi:hypothetical protein